MRELDLLDRLPGDLRIPLEVADAGRESSDAGGVAAGDLAGVLAPKMGR